MGHDLACLLWNSSYMGSKHYLLSLSSYYNYAYMLLAMAAYEEGAHVLLLPQMPYGEGVAHVPMRFYATLVHIGPKQSPNSLLNSSTTNWHQPGVAS
jgi:hypothetical protein